MNTEAATKAKATMHVKVTRKDGRVEEFDIPVSSEMTKEQVRSLIAGQAGACGEHADVEASAGAARFQFVCERHLQGLRESAHAEGLTVTAKRSTSAGLCSAQED